MGIFSSFVQSPPKKNKNKKDISLYFEWNVPIPREELKKYSISPVFKQDHESFIAYINRKLGTLYIYCCSALQWHYDESFNLKIEIRPESFKCQKKNRIKTIACFTKKNPFVAISMNIKPIYYAIRITLPPTYPYSRKDLYLGLKNSGSTCYMSSVLQVLFHIGAFRQLIYSFKDPKEEATAALQHLFVQLQIASRPLTLDNFITAMGSVAEMSFQQQDAHEFLVSLLERLETDLGKPFSNSLSQLFEIKMRKVIKQRKPGLNKDDQLLNDDSQKVSSSKSFSLENKNENGEMDPKEMNKKISHTSSITEITNNAIHTVKRQFKKINLLKKKFEDEPEVNNMEESEDEYEYEYQYDEENENDQKSTQNIENKNGQQKDQNDQKNIQNIENQNDQNNIQNIENKNDQKNDKNIQNNKQEDSGLNDNSSKTESAGQDAAKNESDNENEEEEDSENNRHRKRVRVRVRVEKKDPNMRIVSKFEETFLFLPITVDGITSLRDSLKKMLEPESLPDYEGGPAIQEGKFTRMPPILILQLCRYKFSVETNSVIELTTPFSCPNSIRIGGVRYVLFAVVAHSGSPTFGHYLSFIKLHLGKQWYAFDDAQVSKISKKDVKDSFELKGKSRFKTLTFGLPRAYIVFYCRDDSSNLITATDSIPLYLAPHKTNRFYSHFIFYDQIKGSEINQQHPPIEWADPNLSIYEILRKIRGKDSSKQDTTIILNNKKETRKTSEKNQSLKKNSSSSNNTVKDMINKYSSKNFSSDSEETENDSLSNSNSISNSNTEIYDDNENMDDVMNDIFSIDNRTDSNHIPLAFSAWAMLPGKSQFIGPLSLDMPASAFVVQGHPTEFFLLPGELDNGPIFVASNKPPRVYIDVCLRQNLPQIQGYELLFNLTKVPKELPDGSCVILKPNSPKTLNISGYKMTFKRDSSYSDVQTKLAVALNQSPEKIILLKNKEPLKPLKYPYVSYFPLNDSKLEYQVLSGSATACSVSLYTPVTFIFVSNLSKNQRSYSFSSEDPIFVRLKNSPVIRTKMPIWLKKNCCCKDIIEVASKEIFDFKLNKFNKLKPLCSKGFENFILKPLSEIYMPKKVPIRMDLVRFDVPANKWQFKTMLSASSPMSIEVRMTNNLNSEKFEGIARWIPINKDSTTRELILNVKKLNLVLADVDIEKIKAVLFVCQKVSLQEPLLIDDNLYVKLNDLVANFTIPKMRACVALVVDVLALNMGDSEKKFSHSLSGFFETQNNDK